MTTKWSSAKKQRRIDVPTIIASLVVIFGLVIYLAADPERTQNAANEVFAIGTELFGPYTGSVAKIGGSQR